MNFAGKKRDPLSPTTLGLSGLFGFFSCVFALHQTGAPEPAQTTLLILAATALPPVLLSIFVLKTHTRETAGLSLDGKICWQRTAIKLLGLCATLGLLACAYSLFPEYKKPTYEPLLALALLKALAIPFALAALVYFPLVDKRMSNPHDGYYHLGLFVLGRRSETCPRVLRQHLLGWTVKGFFLPLMIASSLVWLPKITTDPWVFSSFFGFCELVLSWMWALDVAFAVVGYSLTLRVLDSHIRSTEPSLLGWVAALACYPPFGLLIGKSYLDYRTGKTWEAWLQPETPLFYAWGTAILFLIGIYVWSTVVFGCRFSNLTNRGILREGPFRWLKHPAYLSKNLAWWMMYIPFAGHATWTQNLQACLLIGLMNGLYFLRAKTEETHLSSDPAYRIYVRWIRKYGLVACVVKLAKRRSPFLIAGVGLSLLLVVLIVGASFSGARKDSPFQASSSPAIPSLSSSLPRAKECRDLSPLLEKLARRFSLPSLVAIETEHGKIRSAGAAGTDKANGTPVTLQHVFSVASCGKAATALLVLILEEQKLLTLQSTVGDAFPEIDPARPLYSVTLEQLLSHTGGAPPDRSIPEAILSATSTGTSPHEARKKLTLALAGLPPNGKNAGAFLYSNAGYAIAAAVIERLSGQPWETLLQEKIFLPLDLASATVASPQQAAIPLLTAPHESLGGKATPCPPRAISETCDAMAPAGRLYLSAEDFAKWADWLSGGGKREPTLLLSPAGWKKWLSVRTRIDPTATPPSAPRMTGYALGWGEVFLPKNPGERYWMHSGTNGAYTAWIGFRPETESSFVFLTNTGGENATAAFRELAQELQGNHRPSPLSPRGTTDF